MSYFKICLLFVSVVFMSNPMLMAQKNTKLAEEAEQTMLLATKFMVEKVSTNGGYVWYYLPDFFPQVGRNGSLQEHDLASASGYGKHGAPVSGGLPCHRK